MTKTPITVQDLRRRIYLEAKADKAWHFQAPTDACGQGQGFGWKRWSRPWPTKELGLFTEYRVDCHVPKIDPAQ